MNRENKIACAIERGDIYPNEGASIIFVNWIPDRPNWIEIIGKEYKELMDCVKTGLSGAKD